MLVGLAAVAIVVGLALGAGFFAFRTTVASQLSLKGSNAAEVLGEPAEGEPTYTLVAAELGAVAAPLEQAGPDIVILIREDRDNGKLEFISVPSSLKVTVDNDIRRLGDMAEQSDATMIAAVESYAKIDVNHFVKVERGALEPLVDALGGIEVTLDQVIDDPHAGDVYYPAGTYTLNGQGALTYLRATNIRMGKGEQMTNQVMFLKLVLGKIMNFDRGFSGGIEAIDEFVQTDVSLAKLEDFSNWVGEIGLDSVNCCAIPGYFTASSDIVGENGELYVSKATDFQQLIESFDEGGDASSSASAANDVEASSFTVEVLNGTDIAGAANATADALTAEGFKVSSVGNAEQQVYDETLVVYRTKNTPAPQKEVLYDEEGNPIELDESQQYVDQTQAETTDEDVSSSAAAAQAAADAAEQELGKARAQKVISTVGLGRVVEGDMYYAFDADVLLIVGYDYKPVA